ncbi:hypothetical protein ACP4OV_021122 [Aristida adscensionis]
MDKDGSAQWTPPRLWEIFAPVHRDLYIPKLYQSNLHRHPNPGQSQKTNDEIVQDALAASTYVDIGGQQSLTLGHYAMLSTWWIRQSLDTVMDKDGGLHNGLDRDRGKSLPQSIETYISLNYSRVIFITIPVQVSRKRPMTSTYVDIEGQQSLTLGHYAMMSPMNQETGSPTATLGVAGFYDKPPCRSPMIPYNEILGEHQTEDVVFYPWHHHHQEHKAHVMLRTEHAVTPPGMSQLCQNISANDLDNNYAVMVELYHHPPLTAPTDMDNGQVGEMIESLSWNNSPSQVVEETRTTGQDQCHKNTDSQQG